MIFALFLFVCIIVLVYLLTYDFMTVERLSSNVESEKTSKESQISFDEEKQWKELYELSEQKKIIEKKQEEQKKEKTNQLFEKDKVSETVDGREKVQEFIRNNCSEPIEWVDTILPFANFAQMMVKSAEEQVAKKQGWISRIKNKRVLKNIKKWNAKYKKIYELPVYKELIEKWFILPSDVRNYYDSANKEPVHHLWIDYNVKWGTEVRSMYDWKVVESWLDGWLWHKVIIEHTMPDWTKFYSLYGHLGSKDLPKKWQIVEKWMKIWKVWEAFTKDNWNRNSHLHFQIMENIDSPRWYSKTEWEWNYDVLESFGK